jgi:hypothetical protein
MNVLSFRNLDLARSYLDRNGIARASVSKETACGKGWTVWHDKADGLSGWRVVTLTRKCDAVKMSDLINARIKELTA